MWNHFGVQNFKFSPWFEFFCSRLNSLCFSPCNLRSGSPKRLAVHADLFTFKHFVHNPIRRQDLRRELCRTEPDSSTHSGAWQWFYAQQSVTRSHRRQTGWCSAGWSRERWRLHTDRWPCQKRPRPSGSARCRSRCGEDPHPPLPRDLRRKERWRRRREKKKNRHNKKATLPAAGSLHQRLLFAIRVLWRTAT